LSGKPRSDFRVYLAHRAGLFHRVAIACQQEGDGDEGADHAEKTRSAVGGNKEEAGQADQRPQR
jgi:hypothetical protein